MSFQQYNTKIKPHLLFIAPTPPPFAGPEVVSAALLQSELLDSRYEVRHIRSNVNANNADKGRIGLKVLFRFAMVFIKVMRALNSFKPDMVYTLMAQNRIGFIRDAIYIMSASSHNAKIICQFHGEKFRGFYERQPAFFRRIIRRICLRIDLMLVQSENLKSQFSGLIDSHKLRVVPNGVDVSLYRAGTGAGYTEDSAATILFVSSLFPSKGFLDLYEVAKEIVAEGHQISFVFTGEKCASDRNIIFDKDGRALPILSDSFYESNNSSIRFTGPIYGKEKVKLMQASDIFVLPSYSESFPTVVLEAMAAGLPLIITPVGALTEILREGENCLFVQPGNRLKLKELIISLATDKDLRQRMGQANRELVGDKFTKANMQRKFIEVLDTGLCPFPGPRIHDLQAVS